MIESIKYCDSLTLMQRKAGSDSEKLAYQYVSTWHDHRPYSNSTDKNCSLTAI